MKDKYIIIIGCGSLGSNLGNQLSSLGHSVVMVDNNEMAFDRLGIEFSGFKIHGDANEFFVLKQAKADKADIVLAVTDDDNLNIMLAQICQTLFLIKEVFVKVTNPNRQKLYSDLGIQTICPVTLAADSFIGLLKGSI
ncbi:MAG: TrkA family potassium uptake protein [Candidatus Cloacimonadota bacterium]